MKITKYEHACVVAEEQGKRVVIDPGEWTPEFGGVENIAAVIVTHVHPDHFSRQHLDAILSANQDVAVYTTQEVADELRGKKVVVPEVYEDYTAGPFTLRFFGETHAEIHRTVSRPQNIGVSINDQFYYPGDSFTPPDHEIQILAVPAGAPWMKIGEAMDFIQAVEPKRVFPTHTALLSERGLASADKWLKQASDVDGAQYTRLQSGESIEIAPQAQE